MKNREELENDFEWWITCIPDKIELLGDLMPESTYRKLNYSVESFEVIGQYILENFDLERFKQSAELWDCLASYVGTTYRQNVPTAKWDIELDSEKDLFWGIPKLVTKAKTNFYPKYEITAMLDRQRPDFLSILTKNHIELNR